MQQEQPCLPKDISFFSKMIKNLDVTFGLGQGVLAGEFFCKTKRELRVGEGYGPFLSLIFTF